MEDLKSKHRAEQKDLQGRITQKKKNATKKTRKGVNEECERLQRELDERQREEQRPSEDFITGELESVSLHQLPEETQDSLLTPALSSRLVNTQENPPSRSSLSTPKKANRQKARLARRAAEQEEQARKAEEEATSQPDKRSQEMTAMQEQFRRLGFREISVRPDGHCMYSAIARLLQQQVDADGNSQFDPGGQVPYLAVRAETARFIFDHAADFEAFLEEPLTQYTHKIKNTTEWGGQLELQAISKAYRVDIHVLQADGRVEKITCETEVDYDPIWLTYYRHSFGLGEHYNALVKESLPANSRAND